MICNPQSQKKTPEERLVRLCKIVTESLFLSLGTYRVALGVAGGSEDLTVTRLPQFLAR